MIYTGYFAKTKLYEDNGLIPISIARHTPKWFNGKSEPILAPSEGLLAYNKDIIGEYEYENVYRDELSAKKDNIKEVLDKYSNKNVILLCYEKSSDFCHRHLLAEYAKNNFNIDIKESAL